VLACTGHAFPMGAFLLLASDIRIGADGPYILKLRLVRVAVRGARNSLLRRMLLMRSL
jgi:hypothetical protein